MIRSDSVFFLLCSIFPGWFCAERTHPHRARGSGEPLCGDAGLRHAACRTAFQEGHADRRAGGDRWRRVRFLLKTTFSASVHYGGVSQTVHLIHYIGHINPIISTLWACPKPHSVSLISPAGRSPVFSPATSLMCVSSMRSS